MNKRHHSVEAGFTLVEVMAALAIMALMAGIVVLTLPPANAAFRDEVRQLAARLEMASQESVIRGVSLGFVISERGYSFQEARAGSWEEIQNDRFFAPHNWADSTYVALERNSFFSAQEVGASESEPDAPVTLVRFDPTGLPTHFSVHLERGQDRFVVRTEGRDVRVSNDNS